MTEYSWSEPLEQLVAGKDLSREQAYAAMAEIMHGRAGESRIAAFLTALRAKGESAQEMSGFVDAMFDAAVTVDIDEPVVDAVGTGGDQSGTFNISTTAAFIAAGAGARVAKHGNRAASSKAGSADVLESLGFVIDLPPEATVQMVTESRFGFFFAPRYHPAMRYAAPVRAELGFRTVFNFLGPLCNPARADRLAVGTADPTKARLMIEVLQNRGANSAFVFYGEDGLDELTTTAPSYIYRLKNGEITHAEFTPEDFGVERARLSELQGGDAATNAAILREILEGGRGPKRDIAAMNAAPVIVVAGLADGFAEAMALAEQALDHGDAAAALDRSLALSRNLAAS